MAIARKPSRNTDAAQPSGRDEAAEAFINKAGAAPESAAEPEETRKAPVMIRFDRQLLERVDAAAKHRGISRSAWIQFTLSRALDAGEG
jgi:predicted HicB family RNase H-like nuclease